MSRIHRATVRPVRAADALFTLVVMMRASTTLEGRLRRTGCAIVVAAALATLAAGAVDPAAGRSPRGAATSGGANGLIVYSEEIDGHYQLFTVGPDGSGQKQITDATGALNPDWSPDGNSIVFEHEGASSAGIATMAADGTGLRVLTPSGFQGQPSFSPDGSQIVYERDIAPGNNGVWIMRADGTGKRRLTRNPFTGLRDGVAECACDTDPNFSPDGRLVSFVRIKKDEELQALFTVRVDGTGLRQVTPYTWELAIKHDWSPDGELIVVTTNADFAHPRQSANLVTIRPDGSGRKNLTRFVGAKKNAFAGSFSPDGKSIVFRLEEAAGYSLAVVDRDGRHLRRLLTSRAKPRFIDWGTHP